jgi:predicted protein tyrosine phosphatase
MLKKVVYLSRHRAEAITPKPSDKAAIISVNSSHKLANLHYDWHDKLYLIFDDVTKDIVESLKVKYPNSFLNRDYRLFDRLMAKDIISFLDKNAENVEIIVVHCDAGISRSAAIAKFIAKKYNLPFDASYDLYNKWVYNTLLQVDSSTTKEVNLILPPLGCCTN